MNRESVATRVCVFAIIVMCLALATASASVTVNSLFSNNMVLQRDKPIPVWGNASAGENVTVTFNSQSRSTTTDAQGNWKVTLPAMAAKTTGGTLSIAGTNTINITNVVIGDVWLCSGQSNMAFGLGSCNRPTDVSSANFPGIRQFGVPLVTAPDPQRTVSGNWTVCSSSTAGGFSAVSFYFARKIYQELGSTVPVGLIVSSVGGTRIDPWLVQEGFTDIPALQPLYTQSVMPWGPFSLGNGMIHPLAPYGLKGILWYQGENSETTVQTPDSYYLKMKALSQGWQRLFASDDLAFYFVQLANWGTQPANATPVLTSGGWDADTRLQQANAMALPHAGMASALDIGDSADMHPTDKLDLGERLALWALKNDYGRTSLITSGPILRDATVAGSTVVCTFDYVGSGLMVGSKTPYQPTQEVVDGTLKLFSIAGSNGTWYPATATISGDTVVLSSASVTAPRKIAYACWQNPVGANLYNKEGLPASPFYVDDVTVKYTVTASAGTGGSISPNGATTYLKRKTALYTITPDDGYYIEDVKVDGVSVGSVKTYTFDPLYANHTITATFAAAAPSYSITASANAGGSISPSGVVSVGQGGAQTITIVPNPGTQVSSVTVDGAPMGIRPSFTFTDVRANHTISATFACTITAQASYGGTITPSGPVTVAYGSNKTFAIAPSPGYSISNVKVDGVNIGPVTSYTFSNITTDHTISASFSGAGGGTGSVPRTDQLLLSCLASSFPASGNTGNWATYLPSGSTLATIGNPTVEMINGRKWERNVYADGDGYRFQMYNAPIACTGASIVVAARPVRSSDNGNWRSIVDVFYDRLVLGIQNNSGLVNVRRNGSLDTAPSNTAIPDGQITILSLVVQPNGTYKVWANGVQVMSNTSTSTMTSLNPLWNGGGTGFWSYINIGRNNPDGWTTFNGNIGDVFLYKTALTDTERQQLEAYIANKLTDYTITASAGPGGAISPSGMATVMSGASQTYTITPTEGYAIADVQVDGTSVGAVTSYTFSNVNANHTISATFALIATASSLDSLKSMFDGTLVKLTGTATVIYAPRDSANARTTKFFYIGEAQGRGGLKVVESAFDSLSLGNQVTNLTGYIRKPAGKEMYLELTSTATGSGNLPIPALGVNNKTALTDSAVQTNAVRVWGKVKSVNGTTSFTISDGYKLGTVTVMLNGVALPAGFDTTKTAIVTGLVTKDDAGAPIVHAQAVRVP